MTGFGRRLSAAGLAIAMALLLGACGEPEPLRIGFLGGVSGRVADLGIGGRNGAQMAVETINRAGGIDGRQVILVVKDDAQDPEKAARGMREFGQTGIRLVIGPMTSAMAVAALPVAAEFGILMVSPTVTTDELAGREDNFIRVLSPASDYAGKSAEHQVEQNGLRRIVAIHDAANAAYVGSWLSAFTKRFTELGGSVLAEVPFTSGQQLGLRDLVAKTVRGEAEGLLILANSVDAALIAQYARSERPGLPIVMSEWPATERFIELAGAAAEGVTAAQFFDRNSKAPAYEAFRADFRKRFGGEPGFAGVTGYDATILALQGLAKSVAAPGPHLVGIERFEGLQGPISIDRFGDAKRKTFITRVEKGQFKVVE